MTNLSHFNGFANKLKLKYLVLHNNQQNWVSSGSCCLLQKCSQPAALTFCPKLNYNFFIFVYQKLDWADTLDKMHWPRISIKGADQRMPKIFSQKELLQYWIALTEDTFSIRVRWWKKVGKAEIKGLKLKNKLVSAWIKLSLLSHCNSRF